MIDTAAKVAAVNFMEGVILYEGNEACACVEG